MPRRFRLGEREIDVIENLDQWCGVQCRYFKVRGDDESVYIILRFDEIRVVWELVMFQRPQPKWLQRASRQWKARKVERDHDEVRRARLAVGALFKKVLISGLPGTISDF